MSKYKKWSSSAKFEIALQAIKGDMTLNELCKKYEVSPAQVHSWKKQLIEHGADLFNKSDKSAKKASEHEQAQRVLYEKIGELTVERDFLKKCWSKLHGNNGDNS
ncbi:TPA: transposase [Legionella pneumophila]|uniref:transposase n=1 Tax=Legionella pneumophila TaxID=446 RepID=UPI001C13F534|nr:transposase [Legionella pneumophila]